MTKQDEGLHQPHLILASYRQKQKQKDKRGRTPYDQHHFLWYHSEEKTNGLLSWCALHWHWHWPSYLIRPHMSLVCPQCLGKVFEKGQTFRSLVICLLPFQSDKHGNVLKFRGLGYMSSSWGEFSGDRPVAWSAVQRWHWLLRHSEGENCQKVYSQLLAGSNSLVEAPKMGWSGGLVNAITAQLLPSAACSIMSASPPARLATAGRLTSGPTSIQPPS